MANRKIYRRCLACGKRLCITVYPDKKYSNGHFFGSYDSPIKGTGKHVKISHSKVLNADVVKWTGKTEKVEYWECNACYNEG